MTAALYDHKILILDFGSQYTQLIARRVRELGVYSEVYAFDAPEEKIRQFAPRGIILSGGPESVYEALHYRAPSLVFQLGCPLLGICYGMQTLAAQLGGEVVAGQQREFGHTKVQLTEAGKESPLLSKMHADTLTVWMSHGDKVQQLPEGFVKLGFSEHSPIAVMANEHKRYYGVQFHPEVTHTSCGEQLLHNFIHQICGCEALWTPEHIIESTVVKVRQQVGHDQVILGLSGGVDSSVVAALLHRAIGQQLTCIFVDTGLLRFQEGDQVMSTFAEHLGIKVIRINAHQEYWSALKGIVDPEQKRKIIGRLFIEIFDRAAHQIPGVKWLAQGTIYPDVIESAGSTTGKAHVIKSHHNVGGLPEKMHLKLLEPLRELFKDEVRKIGVMLGLPAAMIYRHPFPGPGLAVRILGEVTEPFVHILQQADAIYMQELEQSGYYGKVSQAFAVFLPVKSVGVMGDQRKYDYVIALRAVETIDFMTAHWARLPYELLDRIAHRIVNEVHGVSRVVYDISGKPPATIEWE